MKRLFLLIGLLLAACARSETPVMEAPTRLPTAVPPDTDSGSWAVAFSHEFPAEFWQVGTHQYGFFIQCPVASQGNISTDWLTFAVSEEIPPNETTVYLRLNGISTAPFFGYLPEPVIHPRQPTIAVLYLVGLPENVASLAQTSCEGLVAWDGPNTETLTVSEPFQP